MEKIEKINLNDTPLRDAGGIELPSIIGFDDKYQDRYFCNPSPLAYSICVKINETIEKINELIERIDKIEKN